MKRTAIAAFALLMTIATAEARGGGSSDKDRLSTRNAASTETTGSARSSAERSRRAEEEARNRQTPREHGRGGNR